MKTIANLIDDVRNNDEFALQELINHYTPLIYSIINSYHLDAGDYKVSKEDLFQEATISLYQAALRYKDINKAKFSTFAYVLIKRRLNSIYYSQIKKNQYMYSYDNLENVDHFSYMSQVNEEKMKYDTIDQIAKEINMDEEEKEIIKMRLENYSYDEIAKHLNISKKRVDNRLTRLKRRCKKQEAC